MRDFYPDGTTVITLVDSGWTPKGKRGATRRRQESGPHSEPIYEVTFIDGHTALFRHSDLLEAEEVKAARPTVIYAVAPGFHIYRNRQPFISINRLGATNPVEGQAITHLICGLLNAREKENGNQ